MMVTEATSNTVDDKETPVSSASVNVINSEFFIKREHRNGTDRSSSKRSLWSSTNENLLTSSNWIYSTPNQGNLSAVKSSINVTSSGCASAQSDTELNPFESSDTKIRQELMATDGFGECEFVDAKDFKSIFDKDEEINREEFASNNLTIIEPSSPATQERTPWWRGPIQQQTSYLEFSSVNSPKSSDESISSTKRKSASPIDGTMKMKIRKKMRTSEYFEQWSIFPDGCPQSTPCINNMSDDSERTLTRSVSQLPQIYLNCNEIDFGTVVEGCRESESISFSVANARQLNKKGYFPIEVSDSSPEWLISELGKKDLNNNHI